MIVKKTVKLYKRQRKSWKDGPPAEAHLEIVQLEIFWLLLLIPVYTRERVFKSSIA